MHGIALQTLCCHHATESKIHFEETSGTCRSRPGFPTHTLPSPPLPCSINRFTAAACARRAIKNRCLAILSALGEEEEAIRAMLLRRYRWGCRGVEVGAQ